MGYVDDDMIPYRHPMYHRQEAKDNHEHLTHENLLQRGQVLGVPNLSIVI